MGVAVSVSQNFNKINGVVSVCSFIRGHRTFRAVNVILEEVYSVLYLKPRGPTRPIFQFVPRSSV